MALRRTVPVLIAALLVVAATVALAQTATAGGVRRDSHIRLAGVWKSSSPTATPIKHLAVIFQENVSFDHYFATYPNATNPPGEPAFYASRHTPSVNGLSGALLTDNPNESNPQRLDRSQAVTCDQDHDYTAEQQAFDMGLMDKFVQDTGEGLTLAQCLASVNDPAPAGGATRTTP